MSGDELQLHYAKYCFIISGLFGRQVFLGHKKNTEELTGKVIITKRYYLNKTPF